MSDLAVIVSYTRNAGDNPATGLVLADIDMYLSAVNKTTGAVTVIWNGAQNPTVEVTNTGSYARIYGAADLETYHYVGAGLYTGLVAIDNDWVVGAVGSSDVEDAVIKALFSFAPVVTALHSEDLELYRGDTWIQPIARLGNLTGYTEIWITARADKADTDARSAFQVRLSAPPIASDGLIVINGAAATVPGNASITVSNLVLGDIVVRIEAVETAKLVATDKFYYDVQWSDGTDVITPRRGRLCVISDVTRAVT